MRVVVTRPAHSGERTAGKLAKLGHTAILLPLTRPVHDARAAGEALSASDGAIAVTSAEAIRTLLELGPALTPHLSRSLFSVGKATADEASAAGFRHILFSEGGGAELAELISVHRSNPAIASLIYLAGSPRAAGFEAGLAERGIPFRTVECYRMEDVEPDESELRHIFLQQRPDAVLLHSRHTARRFFAATLLRDHAEALTHVRILCLSASVAEAVPVPLRANVETAVVPEEDSLLALLGSAESPNFI